MAKDRRLYARFDIGFDEHDKIYPLSDAAFRALIEATLYARRQLTDGFLADRLALKRWGADALEELSTNDPDRPSLVRVEGGWQIHDFAEHQTTNADIQAKRDAGAKGGKAKAKRTAGTGVAGASSVPEQKPGTTLAKSESESESDTERLLTTESVSYRSIAREASTDSIEDPETVEAMLRLATTQGVDLPRVIVLADEQCGRSIGHAAAYRLSMHIIGKSKNRLKNPMAYVASTFTKSPHEIQQWIDTEVSP